MGSSKTSLDFEDSSRTKNCAFGLKKIWLRARSSIAIARISYGNSVCLSVTSRYRFKISWDRILEFSPYDSLESVVFRDKILCYWVKEVPTNEGRKRGTLLKRRYSTAIGSSDVKMVGDTCRHRHAAYHNNHWRRSSWECRRPWPWMTLNPKKYWFKWFFCDFWLQKVNCNEMDKDRPRWPANWNCHRLSRVSWALAQIFCFDFGLDVLASSHF